MPADKPRNKSARDAALPYVPNAAVPYVAEPPPDPPAAVGREINLEPPPATAVGAGDPPYESAAPWSIAVQEQHVEQGLTRGLPHSPDPLPNPLIPPRPTDPGLNYEHVRKAGSGAHATVEIVKDKEDKNKQYALKKINVRPKGRMELALREACIMKRLDHKNICRLYSAQIYAGTSVLLLLDPCVMSLYEYRIKILRRMTKALGLETDKLAEMKHIATGLLEGVIYMHGQMVLHRDLKSKNILLKRNGGLKITDFGLARKIKPPSTDGRKRHYTERLGTLSTMAPEVMGGASDYGFETDMWSVGCVLGEMFLDRNVFLPVCPDEKTMMINEIMEICGDLHFDPPHDKDLKMTGNTRHVKEFFKKKGVTDPDALTLLDKGLQIHPSDRYTAERLLKMEFFRNNNPAPKLSMRDPVNYPFLAPGYEWPEDE